MRPDSLGPYDLGEPLGKGGMGAVYRATHRETGERVAVKVLSPRLAVAEGFRDRFEGEIESLKALRHAGIVRLYGYGEEDGSLFYAMEVVEGPSLEEELKNGRRFTWREATQITIQVCRALKHAHDHGVIHRDIKPANILLGPNGQPKLADFGIARMFGSSGVTIAGGVLGTADYMAPEQAAGKPVNARCDQYSLGGVVYALLTGRPPFRAVDLAAMLQLQRFAIPEPVRRFAPDTPQDLERIVAKMLEKDPTDRFPNTLVLARRLEAMSAGLARVAADDFEVYETADQPPLAEADTGDPPSELALAVTRDATDETPDPPSISILEAPSQADRSPTDESPAPPSGVTRYTHVEPSDRADEGHTAWASIAGQAALLLVTVGLLAGVAWWLSRPVSADDLYERIAASIETGDLSSSSQEAVRDFTRRFPDDPRVDEAVEWGRRIELEQRLRRMKLASWIGRGSGDSPEEALLRRATDLAETDPDAGAEAFAAVAQLLLADAEPSADAVALARLADQEADRLRDVTNQQRARLAEFFAERLDAAEGAGRVAVAEAIVRLAPEAPETRAVLDRARAALSAQAGGPVAPEGGVR